MVRFAQWAVLEAAIYDNAVMESFYYHTRKVEELIDTMKLMAKQTGGRHLMMLSIVVDG